MLIVLWLSFYRLPDYPVTWFDEGSHLHVPKALVLYGVYADYSSEGFRYFGPTNGVGPTVLVPIAGVFSLAGIGLTQARVVMAIYLEAAVVAFYFLGRKLGSWRMAWVATAMLVASRGAPLLEYGREVVGEVPALFFLTCMLIVWFSSLGRPDVRKELLAGVLLGLALLTKQQEVFVVAPLLAAGWLANRLYYRQAADRFFIVPAVVSGGIYAVWQIALLFLLSPSSAADNLQLFQNAVGGAALVFSPGLIERGVRELLSAKVYLGALVPALIFTCLLAKQRTAEAMRWFLLLVLIAGNLGWYVFASLSWVRYAFPGLAIGALLIGNFLSKWTNDFRPLSRPASTEAQAAAASPSDRPLRWAGLGWITLIIALPLAQTVRDLAAPPVQAPSAMAAYIDQQVPATSVVETWEPEIGFLSDHPFHYPPPSMLVKAVAYIWLGGPSPSLSYTYVQDEHPDFVLIGEFAKWVDIYPLEFVDSNYSLVATFGNYDLFRRR